MNFEYVPKDFDLETIGVCSPVLKIGMTQDGQKVFSYETKDKMLLTATVRSEEETHRLREEYELNNKVQHDFIKMLAASGVLDCFFFKQFCTIMRRRGTQPRGYQIHHILPLSLGGTNDFENLMLVQKDAHAEIHKRIWDDIYKIMNAEGVGTRAKVLVPALPVVMRNSDLWLLLSPEQLRQKILAEKCRGQKENYHNKTICHAKQSCRMRMGRDYGRGRM